MNTNKLRNTFLDFAKKSGHIIVPSSPLVPQNDPTTLFTGSGMQPMVPYLLGQKHPLGVRLADSQKCFRSQDIEEVGDNRHTTFFEMLGNWSLGDYFKETQIPFMWKFLTEEIDLDPNRLYFTCFDGSEELGIIRDTESAELWQKLFSEKGIDAQIGYEPEKDGIVGNQRIFYYNDKKNWWSRVGIPKNMPVGEPGGPDTEMFYDFEPDETNRTLHILSEWKDTPCHVNCDCGRFIEIGNNVFMEYVRTENDFEKLKQKNVDFGGGLERLQAALINDADVFNINVFDEPKKTIENISCKKYEGDNVYAYRVILDHLRAATFLIGDGVYPGSKDQQYFVRRLIRRAVRFARNLSITKNFTKEIAESFIKVYKDEYTNLEEEKEKILDILEIEETKFRKTLDAGLKQFEKISSKEISGEVAFDLLQTYGFPIELTEELAKEKNIPVDLESFKKLKDEHSQKSRTASAGKFKGGLGGDSEMEIKYHTATHILHQALKTILGNEVEQKGSNITPERLRFDFAFPRKMTDEEKIEIEKLVNETISKNLTMTREEVSFDEAMQRGAIGLFGDKYGDKVSIYHLSENNATKRGDDGMYSIEFCGGPHVESTGNMGTFKIQKEEAVQAGVRRIKAVLI